MSLSESEKAVAETFRQRFQTAEQLRDWIFLFLGIDFPLGHIDPDSNSSPSEWLFDAYKAIENNEGNVKPVYVVYSSRDSYKTLSCAALEVIAMVHFNLTVAHMAAIESQSKKAVQYINSFLRKIKPYLEYHGSSVDAQNTRNVTIKNPEGEIAYLTIIICTLAGANSEHTNLMVVDEVDVVRFPQAYEEAKMIPGVLRGRHPLTVMTSTRKFAFGLMQKEIEKANENNHPVLHWNMLDITERCPDDRHRPDLPPVTRYIAKRLPLRNIEPAEYDSFLEEKKSEYDKIQAHAGCATCHLLSVCKTRLSTRPEKDVGGLYKPIDFTINQFKKINPDMGEAQLLCWKPSSTGLIYARFDSTEGENTLSLNAAWERFTGNKTDYNITLTDLIDLFHKKGIPFYIGGDWGFRHAYALIAGAVLPSGEFWIFETLAISGLEFEDMIKYALYFRDKYKPKRWFMDTAQPMFIKAFKKRKMPCKEFKKDIMGGIESIRGQVVDSYNRRRLKVLKTTENEFIIKGFGFHHFRMDASGNLTQEPDDEEYADVMDSLRYMGQNLFATKGNIRTGAVTNNIDLLRKREEMYRNSPEKAHSDMILSKIKQLTTEGVDTGKGKSEGGSVIWDFTDPYKDKS